MIVLGDKEPYKGIGKIHFERKDSDNPLAFRCYNLEQIVTDKTMLEHFKLAAAYGHNFGGNGSDLFGQAKN